MLDYNDVPALERAFAERGSEIACVITEAAPANMGVITPDPGFNAAIRRIADPSKMTFVLAADLAKAREAGKDFSKQ